ncbi:MAG: helix-turn-helix domain-containing protein [Methanothrix sp.]
MKVLESGSLLTQKDIVNRTYLPARTVRYALRRLEDEKLLVKQFCFPDARQRLYRLKTNTCLTKTTG